MSLDSNVPSAVHATLVLGGARSGKSRFAETLARGTGLSLVYIATSPVLDEETRQRIDEHRLMRGDGWRTVEEELEIASAVSRETAANRVLLVDCLTLWLNNLIYHDKDVVAEIDALCVVLSALKGPCVMVSNEIGMGLVPETSLGRRFRDAQGRLNQQIAETSKNVIFVAAGLPLHLKPSTQSDFSL
ncbi:MAG: bifunctional adenosylcobinamide kinase/adenosylcobinamide-phosphate guanylyltransferase [Rhodobacteraceae bacterium]|nr:bifunctional adenosylcobinamide kinase/adenosylcobinamide-phosphate guanylyltransferase [Paracoccaceae bacterium]